MRTSVGSRHRQKKRRKVSNDKLEDMFKKREAFMHAITNKFECYPSWPVDIRVKSNQAAMRDIALKGVEEMFEALQHLKNFLKVLHPGPWQNQPPHL